MSIEPQQPLQVLVQKVPVGRLQQYGLESVFTYDTAVGDQWVSLTMPVRAKSYAINGLLPIFEMHLPEGYLLSVLRKYVSKLASSAEIELLRLLAPTMFGRLQYQSMAADNVAGIALDMDLLLHSAEPGLFQELVQRFALRSAVSGVQPKVLMPVAEKGVLGLQEVIVKAWGPEFPELALNEFLCMTVCQLAGLPVPEFYLSDNEALFVMKRFDYVAPNQYLGFEDLCVLQARPSRDKYTGSYEQVVKTLKAFVSPPHLSDALYQFFKLMVINYRLQNGDAHLKNFGVLYEDGQSVRLAPAYDVVCTTAYLQHDVPALTLFGSKRWWPMKDLLRFGEAQCDLTIKQMTQACAECEQAFAAVHQQIKNRLSKETHADKRQLLVHLAERLRC